MRPTFRRSFLAALVTCVSAYGSTSNYTDDTTLTEAVNTFDCQCGFSEFLTIPHVNITAREEAIKCSSYKLVDARGTSEPQGVSMMFYPMIRNILANISDGVSLPVEYPAGPDQNTTTGELFVLDIIKESVENCPNQNYALFGYSQGASLILKVLKQLNHRALSKVKSVILVGNPYRVPGKLSSVNGTGQRDFSASVGMFAESAIAAGGNTTISQLSKEMDRSGITLDYCLAGDGVCSYNSACPCQIPASHLSYGLVDTVQSTAFEHVISQLGSH
ncbi:unnamed protein product [Penicillium salamii]|nr:unnamed protein product [Penicillium salamii]CAG8275342.1 unnamed protein product [Penicillium salamii]CAG8363965.1 unnamed protein product [Penicillium salamii]